jgi:hypothetical protein
MLVNELYKEQECIYLYDVGWFCFVSMKQERIKASLCSHNDTIKANTGHDEVISFDLLLYTHTLEECVKKNEAFRLILSVAFLCLED